MLNTLKKTVRRARKVSLLCALLLAAILNGYSATTTVTVLSGTMTNLFTGFNQPLYVRALSVTAATNNYGSALLIDTPTNQFSYVNPAYTNTFSYVTNIPYATWTNYYGVVQSNNWGNLQPFYNYVQIDVTNNLVAASTNTYPVRFSVSSAAGTSTTYQGVNTYFNNGIWATNNSSASVVITLIY